MKKVVFAAQVFGLIALFPVYVIVELNHITARLPVTNFPLDFIEKTQEINSRPALNDDDKALSLLMQRRSLTKLTIGH